MFLVCCCLVVLIFRFGVYFWCFFLGLLLVGCVVGFCLLVLSLCFDGVMAGLVLGFWGFWSFVLVLVCCLFVFGFFAVGCLFDEFGVFLLGLVLVGLWIWFLWMVLCLFLFGVLFLRFIRGCLRFCGSVVVM